ncbi:hypothetical protein E8E14_011828 [Neopestalotiopsis sp. 37M]|nr:hypothetical protein E8E14_011828 [Neopestalotiopsis sp. 37M]
MAKPAQYTHVNQPPPHSSAQFDPGHFVISAAPRSDIHASPVPEPRCVFTAPVSYHPALALSAFRRARISLVYTPAHQYDHAGLVMVLPEQQQARREEDKDYAAQAPDAVNVGRSTSWIKAGLEAKDGAVYLSVVVRPPGRGGGSWCDWSLHVLRPSGAGGAPFSTPSDGQLGFEVGAAVELARKGHALLVNYIDEAGQPVLLRKVPWVFLDNDGGDMGRVLPEEKNGDGREEEGGPVAWVGAFAARPDPEGQAAGEALLVGFRDFEVEAV